MSLSKKTLALAVLVGGFVMIGAALGSGLAPMASGQSTTLSVVSPGTASVGETVTVTIKIGNVANLGAYEWQLAYNASVLELANPPNPVNGPFLGSTGRTVSCPPRILGEGTVRFGCNSSGSSAGPSGSGVLSTVTFNAKAPGGSSLCLRWAGLLDASPQGYDIPLSPGQYQHASIVVDGGEPPPPCPPAATPTPFPTPSEPPLVLSTPTGGPAGPTATSGPPPATPAPTGPTPTPAPTPPSEQAENVALAATCNPVTVTYPDGTTVQTLTGAVSPAGILGAIWKFDGGVWRAYSPRFPQASDLATTAFLDVVFLCTDASGTFVRPRV